MVIIRPEEFATTKTGVKMLEYCYHCYRKGEFTEPDITFDEMVERVASAKAVKGSDGLYEAKAKESAKDLLQNLKRWQKKEGG
jgi:hypothetical protein